MGCWLGEELTCIAHRTRCHLQQAQALCACSHAWDQSQQAAMRRAVGVRKAVGRCVLLWQPPELS